MPQRYPAIRPPFLAAACLIAACLTAGCSQAGADPTPSASSSFANAPVLEDAALGEKTFDDSFERFDVGTQQTRSTTPQRWRTVMGYGGPAAFDNYKITGSSVGIDVAFPGVENGQLGSTPLGLDPFELDPGRSLSLVARPTPPELKAKMWNAPYYSGQITSKFSFSQLYGYFEAEAILPAGKGFWPAFWLLPMEGKWPVGGEIDIFEGLGDPRTIYTTLHWGADHKQAQRKVALPFDASQDYHRYGVAWTRENIIWYVDRREVMRVATPEEVNRPMFVLLNLGVGGSWGGYPDASTVFPGKLKVRRVQVWKLAGT